MVNRLALLNEWREKHGGIPYFQTRAELYSYISSAVIGDEQPITYLEFGVYKGDATRCWSTLNRNPNSEFVGFDSFEGLPETWKVYQGSLRRGHFSTQGMTPKIDDRRVRFVKGWFQDTLPHFLKNLDRIRQLVINNDSDLYSSSLYTLCTLHPWMKEGTIIIFDEFSQVLDEFRALENYSRAFLREYEVIAAAGEYYDRVAIRWLQLREGEGTHKKDAEYA